MPPRTPYFSSESHMSQAAFLQLAAGLPHCAKAGEGIAKSRKNSPQTSMNKCLGYSWQAAFLQLEVAAGLARLLAAAAAPEAAHRPGYDETEAAAVATMALEAATVLLSPEVCLDPALPAEQRAVTDTPPLPEVRLIWEVLTFHLPHCDCDFSTVPLSAPGTASSRATSCLPGSCRGSVAGMSRLSPID